ncbi:N-acetyltransferase [Citricoccus sp. NPDC055426]|uniref:GNAT family N-acetyltransferase n=1 Tax=Citricoccus sp. NPDC055426 TaxID=3155536 RepID=UPI003421D363
MATLHWTTRPERPEDAEAVRHVNLSAFGRADEADLVDRLRHDPAWEGLSLVAVDDADRPVGHALLTRCHIDGAPALALAPCAVVPERQRTGAGTAAIRAALEAARARGEGAVVVLGHPEYYPRFGFARAAGAGIRVDFEVPDEALMVLGLRQDRPVPAGTVRYARAFGL